MNNQINHHGVKGMKWGVRRFQNEDGSLTPAGKKRSDRYQKARDRDKRIADIHKENNSDNRVLTTKSNSIYGDRNNTINENIHRENRIVNRADKYITKNNMSVKDALSRSRNVQKRNEIIGAVLSIGSTAAVTHWLLNEQLKKSDLSGY